MKRGKESVVGQRSRAKPQTALPRLEATSTRSRQTLLTPEGRLELPVNQPSISVEVPGSDRATPSARPKVKARKTPSPTNPPVSRLLSKPGLSGMSSASAVECPPDAQSLQEVRDIRNVSSGTVRSIAADIENASLQVEGTFNEPVVVGNFIGHIDDIQNIPHTQPEPEKVRMMDGNRWSRNPTTRLLDLALVPEILETEIKRAGKSINDEDEILLYSDLNAKFAKDSDYMYIFGKDQLFELGLSNMTPTDHKSSMVYRDMEPDGWRSVARNMMQHNYAKQILTVMPNLKERPKDWEECVKAGDFKIINGQHTWKAATNLYRDNRLRDSNEKIVSFKTWDVRVVWTQNHDHLHALSFKCNDGYNDLKHLTSLPRAIIHCRALWEKDGMPPSVRRNAASKKKKDAGDGSSSSEAKTKFEVLCQFCCHLQIHFCNFI